MRDFGEKPRAPWSAAMSARHVGLGPSLVDEDETGRIKFALMAPPAIAFSGDVGPILLAGVQRFF
jgi:hypothetical protein